MLQQNSCGNNVLPLMMGFTNPTLIETCDQIEHFAYDDAKQITQYDMRTVGTKSLKSVSTASKLNKGVNVVDKKNEIDDTKNV